jgi:5-formyltetrahydrofolate cyclo-ligase
MIEDIRTQKKNLRKKILALRDAIPSEERRKKSASIHLHLFSLPEFVAAQSVAFFVSFKSEVLTDPEFVTAQSVAFFVSFKSEVLTESMIREALALPKVVAVPTTDLTNRRLLFSLILSREHGGSWSHTLTVLDPLPGKRLTLLSRPVQFLISGGKG